MGKFDGVLLVSDFDDTLYASNVTSVSDAAWQATDAGTGPLLTAKNSAALDYFMREGGKFTVATGRAKRTFARYIGRIPMNAPAILANGAVIYDFEKDEELYHAYLRPEIAQDTLTLGAAMPNLGFETQFDDEVFVYHPNEVTWRHLARMGLTHVECAPQEMPQPWTKLILQDDHPALEAAQKFILERWGDVYGPIFSNHYLLEVTAKGNTKGTMVLRLAEQLGIARENIYCAGDNQNDLPMLEIAAIGFAPANCAPELRQCGARIVRACDESCMEEIVEILDGRY